MDRRWRFRYAETPLKAKVLERRKLTRVFDPEYVLEAGGRPEWKWLTESAVQRRGIEKDGLGKACESSPFLEKAKRPCVADLLSGRHQCLMSQTFCGFLYPMLSCVCCV